MYLMGYICWYKKTNLSISFYMNKETKIRKPQTEIKITYN